MTDHSQNGDLEARLDAIEQQLNELASETDRGPRNHRSRRPSPRGLARFTERHVLPTGIAMLRANIRALEALQDGLRAIERQSLDAASDPPARDALRRLEDLIDDLEDEWRPPTEQARDIVQQLQGLNRQLQRDLAGDAFEHPDREEGVAIDVEDELAALKEGVDDPQPSEGSE